MWEEKVMSEKEKKYVGTKFSTGELVQMELEAKAKKAQKEKEKTREAK